MASLSTNLPVSSADYPASRRNDSLKHPATAINGISKEAAKSQHSRQVRHMPTDGMRDKNRQIRKKMKKRVFRGGQQHWSGI